MQSGEAAHGVAVATDHRRQLPLAKQGGDRGDAGADREPAPFVTRWRSRTVAKVDSIGFVVRVHVVLGGEVVARQQPFEVVADPRRRLRPLRELLAEGARRSERVAAPDTACSARFASPARDQAAPPVRSGSCAPSSAARACGGRPP